MSVVERWRRRAEETTEKSREGSKRDKIDLYNHLHYLRIIKRWSLTLTHNIRHNQIDVASTGSLTIWWKFIKLNKIYFFFLLNCCCSKIHNFLFHKFFFSTKIDSHSESLHWNLIIVFPQLLYIIYLLLLS